MPCIDNILVHKILLLCFENYASRWILLFTVVFRDLCRMLHAARNDMEALVYSDYQARIQGGGAHAHPFLRQII